MQRSHSKATPAEIDPPTYPKTLRLLLKTTLLRQDLSKGEYWLLIMEHVQSHPAIQITLKLNFLSHQDGCFSGHFLLLELDRNNPLYSRIQMRMCLAHHHPPYTAHPLTCLKLELRLASPSMHNKKCRLCLSHQGPHHKMSADARLRPGLRPAE